MQGVNALWDMLELRRALSGPGKPKVTGLQLWNAAVRRGGSTCECMGNPGLWPKTRLALSRMPVPREGQVKVRPCCLERAGERGGRAEGEAVPTSSFACGWLLAQLQPATDYDAAPMQRRRRVRMHLADTNGRTRWAEPRRSCCSARADDSRRAEPSAGRRPSSGPAQARCADAISGSADASTGSADTIGTHVVCCRCLWLYRCLGRPKADACAHAQADHPHRGRI
mmetsp:Transcript_40427/g.86206  ORF Transcript_40427/g.86206 Transcript_40427/m.86206 type:complete len:226 (-) Transcript_40427:193-870(-)